MLLLQVNGIPVMVLHGAQSTHQLAHREHGMLLEVDRDSLRIVSMAH